MNCKDIELKIIDYLDGNLDEKTRDYIEKHLETCNYCLDSLRESQEILKIMADAKQEMPDESLRINFYNILHDEIKKNSPAANGISGSVNPAKIIRRNIFYAAAGFALLICGTLLGMFISSGISGKKNSEQIARLQSEVTSLKENAVYSMLNRESSSERIQAVNYVDELPRADKALIDVLINTLNNDKNVNVRMAAAYALEKYADQQSVCDSLVQSLSHQTDPILQVTLINILVEQKVKSAAVPIKNIINNNKTIKEVRNVAENAIKTLI
jgi:hypothetical protein